MVESWDAVRLAQPVRGHFDLGSGHHGDVWLELDALLLRPAWLRPPVRWMADRLREHAVNAVCGPVEGGAFLAYAVSDLLTAAFLPGYRTPGGTSRISPAPGARRNRRGSLAPGARRDRWLAGRHHQRQRGQRGHGRGGLRGSGPGPGRGARCGDLAARAGRRERGNPGAAGRALLPGRHATGPHLARRAVQAVRRGRPAQPCPA